MENLKDIFKKLRQEEQKETYSLRIITEWLKSKNITYNYSSSNVDMLNLYEHGLRISFKDYKLSVQTHPTIAGWAFAESLKTNDIISDTRHANPEDLFNFIEGLIQEEEEKHL